MPRQLTALQVLEIDDILARKIKLTQDIDVFGQVGYGLEAAKTNERWGGLLIKISKCATPIIKAYRDQEPLAKDLVPKLQKLGYLKSLPNTHELTPQWFKENETFLVGHFRSIARVILSPVRIDGTTHDFRIDNQELFKDMMQYFPDEN